MKTRAEITAELKSIVKSDKNRWLETAFDRAINTALFALSESRPITMDAEITLISGTRRYDVPADLLHYIGTDWGVNSDIEPWDLAFPGVVPRIFLSNTPTGRCLEFSVAPNAKHLRVYGSTFSYWYAVAHELTETVFTVRDDDYDLFITRAMAALMKELVASNVSSPIQLHRGMGSLPNSATPVTAHKELMALYNEMR